MALSSGTRLGPYRIEATLGMGGMGEVYSARDTRLDRSVAIKILAPKIAADPVARARFEREARAVATLDHPNICGIYDVGEANGTHFLVMPLLEGQTLAARLEKGPLPLDQALTIATQIADALDRAHRQGIVHRDLKPANIMLTKAGAGSTRSPQAKLLDFGLAKLRTPAGPISMSGMGLLATTSPGTGEGTILGTLHYMAPEQVEGREADARSDVWALGVVLYEMLTGARPFPGETPASVIGAILKDAPPPLSSRHPLTPPALDHLVERCLAKDPDERWQSAADVRTHLLWISREPARPATGAPRTRGPRWWATLAMAALLLVVLGDNLRLRWVPGESTRAPVRFTISLPPGHQFTGPGASVTTPQVALSPDGRLLAFVVVREDGQRSLWMRDLAVAASRPLPGTEGAADPFWSPDGRRIAFFGGGMLKTLGLGTSDPPVAITRATIDPRGGTWSASHGILFSAAGGGLRHLSNEAVQAPTGGTAQFVSLTLDGPRSQRWPEFLPDGRHFLYFARDSDAARRGVYLGAVGDAETVLILRSEWNARYASGHLLFVQGDALMAQPLDLQARRLTGTPVPIGRPVGASSAAFSAFGVSATGVLAYAPGLVTLSTLEWTDRSGRFLGTLQQAGDFVDFRISPDGDKLAFSKADPENMAPDMWIQDLTRHTVTPLVPNSLSDAAPLWSPRGDAIIFRSNRSGPTLELFRTAPENPDDVPEMIYSRAGQPTESGASWAESLLSTDWSADGRFLVFHSAPNALNYDISALALDSRERLRITSGPGNETHGVISPDSMRIAYASDESGRYEIYVQAFPTPAQRIPISSNGGLQPRWRADGRELFYLQPDGTVMAVPIRATPQLAVGTPVALFKLGYSPVVNPYRWDYVPAPDGQRFIVRVPIAGTTPPAITVVLNWTSLLNR